MHNFIYSLRILFKNKILIFWTFAFPILLGTFFYMAFSNIEDSEKLDRISIAIVENEAFENRQIVKEAFEALSDEEGLFNTIYVEEKKEAERCLANDEIIGYLFVEEEPKIVVKTSGINQTILKATMEEILQMESIIQVKIEKRMQESLEQGIAFDLTQDFFKQMAMDIRNAFEEEVSIKDISSSHLSYTMIEFYTLIAMACLYGGILGMTSINQILPNMSHTGKRISISPASKGKLILSSVCASFVTQLLGIFLLFLYTIFVLKVDYGNKFPFIILLAFVGSLAGLSLGIFIATCLKANDNLKTSVIIAVTMLGCFLSGMMGITMKYVIDKNVPILNKLNPASMITDGFYSLYYYDTFDRFYMNVGSLLLFALLLIGFSMYQLRRQTYDRI
jgi:ABC-2 type transport system permease protein